MKAVFLILFIECERLLVVLGLLMSDVLIDPNDRWWLRAFLLLGLLLLLARLVAHLLDDGFAV